MTHDITAFSGEANWEHPQYTASREAVFRMRTSVAGEAAVKEAGTRLLPHPCADPEERAKAHEAARYDTYLEYAEYENVPSNTLETLIGAMFRIAPVIDAPSTPDIVDDADGNGNTLQESIELTASECLQMRYHGLLVEFSDLAGEDISELSVQDARDRNIRSTIKHYPRESIVNWSYRVIKGARQLNMVILREKSIQSMAPEDISKTGVSLDVWSAFLILGIDANGEYFQRRCIITRGEGKGGTETDLGPLVYPEADGSRLGFIPFEIVLSTERQIGDIPQQLGYLDPISSKTIHRYQSSALLKEALRITAQPTSWTKGWTKGSLSTYREATGLSEVVLGAGRHLPLPDGVDAGFLEWNADSNALFKYREENQKELVALGAVFSETGEQAQTATAAAINSAKEKGILSTLVKNLQESYTRVLGWVAMFEGASGEGAKLELNREFVSTSLDAATRAQIVNEFLQSIISRREALRQLERGGATVEEIDTILDEVERVE